MRKLWMILSIACLISCSNSTFKQPDFILGNWIRLNDKLYQKTYENWKPDFTGIGFTLQKNDTVFKEILSIVEKKGHLYLKVKGVNEQPTLFKFTEQTKVSFTCENPKNEFPKKIQYSIVNDTLRAVISDRKNSIDFIFVKSQF